jgi:predicted phage tail protein
MSPTKTQQNRERTQRTILIRGQMFASLVWAAMLWSGSDWTLTWRTALATVAGVALFFTVSLGVSLLLLRLSQRVRRHQRPW